MSGLPLRITQNEAPQSDESPLPGLGFGYMVCPLGLVIIVELEGGEQVPEQVAQLMQLPVWGFV